MQACVGAGGKGQCSQSTLAVQSSLAVLSCGAYGAVGRGKCTWGRMKVQCDAGGVLRCAMRALR
jgi:hypothetical protein